MREILFRAKRIDNGEWVVGSLLVSKTGKTYIRYYPAGDSKTSLQTAVDPNTVGQYTGLTGKNGKMIFEGDVLNTPNGKWLVVAVRGGFGVVRRSFMSDYDAKLGFHSGLSEPQNTVYTEENAEVIGNIHDNPELLEVSK